VGGASVVAPCLGSSRGRSTFQRTWRHRYQYKIAVYAELRQDTKTALKFDGATWLIDSIVLSSNRRSNPTSAMCGRRYYDAAYMALLDLIPATRTPLRMTELKVVAQHINFKVRPVPTRNFDHAPPRTQSADARSRHGPMPSCAGCKS